MKKKRLGIFIGSGVMVFLALCIIYWFYFAEPTSFPSNEKLIEEMDSVFPAAGAQEIQDTVMVNDKNVLVPFISDNDDYGLSYWVWKNHKWRPVSIDSTGAPMIWKVNEDDPSTYRIVWNIHPEDQIRTISFYLQRDRGYQITDGVEYYNPTVQLEETVTLKGKSYGVRQFPGDWVAFMSSFSETEAAKQPDSPFTHFFPGQYMSFGWIPYDQSGELGSPDRSLNGNGFSNGIVHIDYMPRLSEEDLER